MAHAQALPTATQDLRLSAFGGINGTYTGLSGGRNLAITAGADLGLRTFHRYEPYIEVRGTYPINKGSINSYKNILVGLKVGRTYGRVHPYIDFLIGRGAIDYGANGYPDPTFTTLYLSNPSTVYSPGLGFDIDLSEHFAFKADGQYQRYNTPVTTSGTVAAKAGTLGLIYRFDFVPRKKKDKRK